MQTAKIFTNGRSQAVRLPKDSGLRITMFLSKKSAIW